MTGVILDSDSAIKEVMRYDDADDKLVVKYTQDIEPIIEDNKRRQNTLDGYTPSRDMRHVAHIPNVVIQQWLKEGFDIFKCTDEELNRKLRDPDNKFLLTCKGQL